MTRDSDIDLLVITASPSNTLEEYGEMHRALRGLGFPFDVFLIATERFEETKGIFGRNCVSGPQIRSSDL